MRKKLILIFLLVMRYGYPISIPTEDILNLSGVYNCNGHSNKFGAFRAQMKLIPSVTATENNGITTYSFDSKSYPGDKPFTYDGEAIANKNNIAIHFKNIDVKQKYDYGVGIATANYNLGNKYTHSITINMFYYAPFFKGGANGVETCTRISTENVKDGNH